MFVGMSIGQLGRATGTAVETIRYYEKIGLLPEPARTAANYRSYGTHEETRLHFVRRARGLGLGLDQVRTLLSLADDRTKSCGEVDEIARTHLDMVNQKIADLNALKRELGNLINQCGQGTIAECRILEALAPRLRSDKRSKS